MNVIRKMSWLRAVMISCVKLNTKIAIFISLLSYLALDNELTAAKVFVIFSYYEILKYTLVDFLPLAITFTLEAYVSIKRMQEFLLLPEVNNADGVDLITLSDKKTSKRIFEKIGNGFDEPKVLVKERRFIPRLVREAIENRKHPNFNREDGWRISSTWDPIISKLKSSNFNRIRQNNSRQHDASPNASQISQTRPVNQTRYFLRSRR